MADTELIALETRDGDHWLNEISIRIVEVWAKMRRAGYVQSLGFGPDNLRIYVDFVRWLAREELRTFSHGVAGRVEVETSARMAESGISLMNQIIGLFRKATILRYVATGNMPADARRPPAVAGGDGTS